NDGANATGDGLKRTAELRVTRVGPEELSAGAPGTTTCQGDSGGPWLSQSGGVPTIIGLTSYGPIGCGDASTATRVDRVMDFLMPSLNRTAPPAPQPPVTLPPPAVTPAPAVIAPPPVINPPPPGGGTVQPGSTVQGTVSGAQTDSYS